MIRNLSLLREEGNRATKVILHDNSGRQGQVSKLEDSEAGEAALRQRQMKSKTKHLLAFGTLVAVISMAGCIFVEDADQAWRDGHVDKALIGTWTGTNTFRSLRFEESNGELLLSVEPSYSLGIQEPPMMVTNVRVRTTLVLGCEALLLKDIWGTFHTLASDTATPTTNPLPSHLVHGYLLAPYRIQGNSLTVLVADSLKIDALIKNGKVGGFLGERPPARDFTPPILASLDSNTISVLKPLTANNAFGAERQEFKRSDQDRKPHR